MKSSADSWQGLSHGYDQYRKSLLDAYYSEQLTSFVSQFDPNKKTVFLLPGGMGAGLNRSDEAYPTQDPNFFDYQLWVGLQTLSGGNAPYIKIDQTLADGQKYVVGAAGPINFMGLSPYDNFIGQGKEEWNLFVFGFDWRRSIEECADFYMRFLREFRARVHKEFKYDPLPETTLLAHSMGGLVLAYALHDVRFEKLPFNGYMTIGTNFYGWPGQIKKYYLGQSIFNLTWGVKTVAQTVGCLPGGYSLMPMPTKIFTKYGAQIGLKKYPVRDKDTGAATDPYDPACASRWPPWVFQKYLRQNIGTLTRITNPFDRAVASRFFNVRSILNGTTTVELLWKNIAGAKYKAGSDKPISEVTGPGDGVIPYWSAFHVGTPASNQYNLKQGKDHVFLLEEHEVFELVEYLVENGRLPIRHAPRRRKVLKIASPAVTEKAVLSAIKARRRGRRIRETLLKSDYKRGVLRLVMS